MPKKSPKQPAPPKPKALAPNVNKQAPQMPPEVFKRMIEFYRDSREIERRIWRSIYG